MAKHTKSKPEHKPTVNCKNCSCVCIRPSTTGVHNIAENNLDNLPSYPTDNEHFPDVGAWGRPVTQR